MVIVVFGIVLGLITSSCTATATLCPPDASTCSECISAHHTCSWCSGEVLPGASRCLPKDTIQNMCLSQFSKAGSIGGSLPYEPSVDIKKNKPLRQKRRIKPQRIELAMRRGSMLTIPIEVLSLKRIVKIKFRSSRDVEVTATSSCKRFQLRKKAAKCRSSPLETIKLNVMVKTSECLSKTKVVRVMVNGDRKQSLKIKLSSICSCNIVEKLDPVRYTRRRDQCDVSACGSSHGEICGGERRGRCVCGRCRCLEGYTGSTCSQTSATNKCPIPIPSPSASKPCPNQCQALKDCVLCYAHRDGPLTPEQCQQTCGFMAKMATIVDDVVVRDRGGPALKMCMLPDGNGCLFKFSHNFHEAGTEQIIRIEKEKMCK